MKLQNIILSGREPESRWDVDIEKGIIKSIEPSTSLSPVPTAPLLLPSLCHPHVHLDKAYLLTGDFDYTDLTPRSGSFTEALALTARAKERYTPDDLYLRGAQLLATSATQGVTSCRAFVEVDHVTRHKGLEAALMLKRGFENENATTGTSPPTTTTTTTPRTDASGGDRKSSDPTDINSFKGRNGCFKVQICAFAQDPLFSAEYHGEENRRLLIEALDKYCGRRRHIVNDSGQDDFGGGAHAGAINAAAVIEALGTTPYVEVDVEASRQNIQWAIEMALKYSLHLDFHLDYNLDQTRSVMVWDVLKLLKEARWTERADRTKTIVLGHCSRLTLCSDAEMARLAHEIRESGLPIYFVGLPTSDLFMMGRPQQQQPPSSTAQAEDGNRLGFSAHAPHNRPRGTIQVVDMISRLGLEACLSINNVGNAFTPWGTGDPLHLASLGIGVYQAGTEADARTLYECVSVRARRAIGLDMPEGKEDKATSGADTGVESPSGAGSRLRSSGDSESLDLKEGDTGPFLLIRNKLWVGSTDADHLLPFKVPARQRASVKDVVWDPPDIALRQVIY
ncbi:hypothetical protein KCU88_g5066, partial [Aureobasidium melanogenum]